MADRIENYVFAVSKNVQVTLQRWSTVLNKISKVVRNIIAIVFSEWRDWTPTEFSASGSMTFAKTGSNGGKYLKVGNTVIYSFSIVGTTGGVASSEIYANLPFLPNEDFRLTNGLGVCLISDGTDLMGVTNVRSTRTDLVIRKYDISNYAIAAGVTIRCFGIYECANLPEYIRE